MTVLDKRHCKVCIQMTCFEKLFSSNSEYKVTMQPPVQWTTTQNAEKNLEKVKLKECNKEM